MSHPADLEERLKGLARDNRRLTVALCALAAFWLVGAAPRGGAAVPTPGRTEVIDHIVVRKLTVVDQNGRERVVLAAPLPEPRLIGMRSKRGETVSGVLLFDSNGNERGGYVTDDGPSGSVSLTLDEVGRMAVSLWAGERGSAGLRLGNQDGDVVDLNASPAGASLTLYNKGKASAVLPAPEAAAAPEVR